MLKGANSMKNLESPTSVAVDALRQLLENVPILRLESAEGEPASGRWQPEWIARVRVGGRKHQLVCEYRSNGQPRHARSALLELSNYIAHQARGATGIFIAPYLSPAVRKLCEAQGIGYLDLEGNARIVFGGVFIERRVQDKPLAAQRELKSLFKPKSAQVLRAMLRDPGRAWRVAELSKSAGVSLGHVSNVRTGLVDREWARIAEDGLVLSEPDALLDAWRDSYTAPAGERLRFYTPLHGRAFDDACRTVLRAQNGQPHAAFASFSAAQWLAPFGRTGTHYLMADAEGVQELQAVLQLAPASKGDNLIIIVPKDVALLGDTVEPAPGAVCTSPVQTYLDLSIAGERGAEAADHLRQEILTWPTSEISSTPSKATVQPA